MDDYSSPTLVASVLIPQGNDESSQYRGVRKVAAKRWKAMIRVGKVNYELGYYDSEEAAARAYDIASICVHGKDKRQNFPYADYVHYAQQFSQVSLGELSTILRSQVSAKTSRTSRYRGVRFNKTAGKWEATIHVGKNQIYLGLYEQESQAAQAFDQAAMLACAHRAESRYGAGKLLGYRLNFPPETYEHLTENCSDIGPGPTKPSLLQKQLTAAVLKACQAYYTSAQISLSSLK